MSHAKNNRDAAGQSKLMESAAEAFRRHDYGMVVELLSSIPFSRLSEDAVRLLHKAQSLDEEVRLLIRDMDEAVGLRQLEKLPSTLKRLLKLKPGYSRAQELLNRLQTYGNSAQVTYRFSDDGDLLPSESLFAGNSRGLVSAGAVGIIAFCLTAMLAWPYLFDRTRLVKVMVDDFEVDVRLAGQPVLLRDGRGEIRLASGTHEYAVDRTGETILTGRFTVQRDEENTLVLRLPQAVVEPIADPNDVPRESLAVAEVESPPTVEAAPEPEWIDLLEWTAGVDWKSRGIDWNAHLDGPPTREGITFRAGSKEKCQRFPLAAMIEGDYDAEFEFRRESGTEGVGVYFPVGGHGLHLGFGGANGKTASISSVDGKNYSKSELHRAPSLVENGVDHRIAIRVRHTGEDASFEVDWDDEANYFAWSGQQSRLWNAEPPIWRLSMLRHLWLWSYANNVTFLKARVRAVSGSIRRSWRTDEDRQVDRNAGMMRLTDEQPTQVTGELFVINQIPLWATSNDFESVWPLVTEHPEFCDQYFAAHAPSRLKCPIPEGAKSFAAFGYNDASRTTAFRLLIDQREVYHSGKASSADIRVDLPDGARFLELITEDLGDKNFDQVYWCEPRFSRLAAAESDGDHSADLPCEPSEVQVGYDQLARNKPFKDCGTGPLDRASLIPCSEFLFAHAPSTLTYSLPAGATLFEAIGYCAASQDVNFRVFADDKLVVESGRAGIVPIKAELPAGASRLVLKVEGFKRTDFDRAMWCFPRVYLQPTDSPVSAPKADSLASQLQRMRRVTFAGHQYLLVPGNWSWDWAKSRCEELGGHLATIDSADEGDFLLGLLRENASDLWIGAARSQPGGPWSWSDGRPLDEKLAATLTGEPVSLYGGYFSQDGNWRALSSNGASGCLCEWDSDDGSGIPYQPAESSTPWTTLLSASTDQLQGVGKAVTLDRSTGIYTVRNEKGMSQLQTPTAYRDFELECEARLPSGRGNSGIIFRNRLELELDPSMWSGIWDGKQQRHVYWGRSGTPPWMIRGSGWNRFRIRAEGSDVRVWINDLLVGQYAQPKETIEAGPVIFAACADGKSAAEFREIRVRPLGPVQKPKGPFDAFEPRDRRVLEQIDEDYEKALNAAIDQMKKDFLLAKNKLPSLDIKNSERKVLSDALEAESSRFEEQRLVPFSEPMRGSTAIFIRATTLARNKAIEGYSRLILQAERRGEKDVANSLKKLMNDRFQPFVAARWRHQVGGNRPGEVVCLSNGRIGSADSAETWTLTTRGRLQFRWPNKSAPKGAWVDDYAISQPGDNLTGQNNVGTEGKGTYVFKK